MGVYIKNMEIRENCMNCAARHGAECWLADCSYIPNYRKERPKWCPLVPVPPHGRLGDLDALIAMLERQINNHEKQAKMADAKGTGYTNDMYICDRNRDIIPMLKTAPTIIPAEPEEEEMK